MTKYFCILTDVGAAKLANATALGQTLEFSEMALGDGGGSLPTPDQSQASLINEVRRAPLNSVEIDENNPNWIVCEQVLPASVGGWTIREMAIYDTDGDMVAVGNFPETYKPVLEEGSGRTQTIRMVVQVSNVATVTLKIDPSVVLATRQYVDQKDKAHADAYDPHPQYRNASNLNAGTVPAERIPALLTTAYSNERGRLSDPSNNAKNHFYQMNHGDGPAVQGWIAAAFGDDKGDRVVIGQYDGCAVVGSHVSSLNGWAPLWVQPTGRDIWIGPQKAAPWHSANLTKATGAAVTVGTNDASFITPKALKDAGISSQFGLGYSWHDETEFRIANTEFINTSDHTIVVSVMSSFTVDSYGVGFDVDGEPAKRYHETSTFDQEHEITVPPFSTYMYVLPNGTVRYWKEFKK